jgi:ATP-dependent DNA ligase
MFFLFFREEGIMIKNLDSIYVPNERKEKWIKLKPEYIDGIGDTLDLIILGVQSMLILVLVFVFNDERESVCVCRRMYVNVIC